MQDPLITHADGARALGARLVAAQYRQPEVRSFTIPIDDGTLFPLVNIGELVQVGLATPVRGTVSGIRVDATQSGDGAVRVRQTVTLGEDSGNQWAVFAKMLPQDPLLAATITTDHGDATCTVMLTAGGSLRVRGTGTPGSKVYVRGGQIEGSAPSMTSYDLAV